MKSGNQIVFNPNYKLFMFFFVSFFLKKKISSRKCPQKLFIPFTRNIQNVQSAHRSSTLYMKLSHKVSLAIYTKQYLYENIQNIISPHQYLHYTVSDNVSELGRDKGFTVKYNHLPERVPEGEARGNS